MVAKAKDESKGIEGEILAKARQETEREEKAIISKAMKEAERVSSASAPAQVIRKCVEELVK